MNLLRVSSLTLCLAFLSGCSSNDAAQAPAQAPQPVPVEPLVVTLRPEVLSSTLPGRIVPARVAEVRARVAGIVQKRHFTEGAMVGKGDLLFTIDPAPLQAAAARARAAETRAAALEKQAASLVRRYQPLVKADAVSQQEYDEAVASLETAKANRASAAADVRTAQLDLGYATVRSPIAGRIGKSLVSEGALVGQGEATPMALVQQMDPIYADFTQPASTALQLREALASGALSRSSAEAPGVTISVDGTGHSARGRLLFSDVSVDPGTGQVTLRGEFANPKGVLLPGMFVRVSAEMGTDREAIFVPQRAILRGTDGIPKVMVISAKSVAEERAIKTGAMQGAEWQVTEGLKAGDRLIVKGVDKIAPGTPVSVAAPAATTAAAPTAAAQ
ncbi:efflux RND transporter periplasmic adaptor subunit (plasmid) [Massilia varians]